ncbi:lasso peptide biosynthesis B2 protein [Wenzhouxiangella sp. EGI_FJ10305]|uniref:lasso peptide biosynthesis B2 protein n=1 Tax=Wenzhouxiangella sp. EGI_FJ10305 TaxID=3243768 RepID=UPI0035D6D011
MADFLPARAIHRWRALPREERRDLIAAASRLPMAHAVLRITGLKKAQRLLGKPRSGASATKAQSDMALWMRRGKALRRLGARMPGVHCLSRALCLWAWMRRSGLDPDLNIGIRPSGSGRIFSHAWVTLDGSPVDETPESIADCKLVDWPKQPFDP